MKSQSSIIASPGAPNLPRDPTASRLVSAFEFCFGAFIVIGRNVFHVVPNEVITLSNGQKMSVAEALLRSWARSKDSTLQRAFVEIAFGKVPDKLETTLENKPVLILHVGHKRRELLRNRELQRPGDDNGEETRWPLLPDKRE